MTKIINWENQVQKMEFPNQYEFELQMPTGAIIVGVEIKDGQPFMWVVVDMGFFDKMETKNFKIYGTNASIKNDNRDIQRYTGTFTDPAMPYVACHVFEILHQNLK